MSTEYEGWIGVQDSGVGGISVLRTAALRLPNENFLFYGDSEYAPYGEKSSDEVLARTRFVTEHLLDLGCKAILIACHTATSVAAQVLRTEHPNVPIVGVEPAVKPAARDAKGKTILVMATAVTLQREKFRHLVDAWGRECTIISVACSGLAERIEQGNLNAPDLYELIEQLVGQYRGRVDGVVLGCTHYPFVRDQIRSVVGAVPFYDSSDGSVRRLESLLDTHHLRAVPDVGDQGGRVEFLSSKNDPAAPTLYRWFFNQPL